MKPPLTTLSPTKPFRRWVFSATLAVSLSVVWPAWAAAPFTVNGNGTVTDATTRLVWDQCAYGLTGATCDTGTIFQGDWPTALAKAVEANAASYKGFTDWRVPNKNELESIVKTDTSMPSIDSSAFPSTPKIFWFWTSTTSAFDPIYAWYVNFGYGAMGGDTKNGHAYVRLVRSGQSFASFDLLSQKLSQTIGTISFNPSILAVGGTSTASATSTSGLAVSFGSTTPTTCSVSGSTVSGVSAGTCTIAADQPGNTTYSAAPQVTANITVTPATTSRLINISTRGQVSTGDGVMIGGFIISGTANKKVLIRAIGPNLANFGIAGTLPDPKLELFEGPTLIGSNDNWQTQAVAADVAAITATGLAPANVAESALLVTLKPGVAYTAVVTGVNVPSGVGIVEVFEADHPEYQLINISTRGRVQTGEGVMIGGFIIQGDAPKTVLVRAVGPNLANFGVSGVLADPVMEIYRSSDGLKIASNDDWQTQTIAADVSAIAATGLPPANPRESAILLTLPPGAYTAVVSGKDGGTGVGIVEVFAQ